MQKQKNMAILIATLLLISSGAIIIIPSTSAHSPPLNIQLLAFCNVAPNPAGVGQSVTIGFWLNEPPLTAGGPYGDRYTNMKVTVTKPDGTTQTLGPFTSDDTGGTSTQFVPSTTGTYTFQMSYPGQTLTGGPIPASASNPTYINDTILPAASNIETLTVQQNPVTSISVAPLPTNYWQTPINALNVNNWYSISGAWLHLGSSFVSYNATGNYNAWTTAPTTSHILWTKPEAFGGVLGGQYGGTTTYGNYYSTSQYERKYNPVMMNGYLYYTAYPGSSTTPTANICVDLYTGQIVWSDNAQNYGGGSPIQTALTTLGVVTPIRCGQILDYVTPNQYGGLAYIWTTGTPAGIVSTGTTWNMFDALTGQYILSVVNGTSPTTTVDANGNLIGYYVNATAGTQLIDGPINPVTGPTRVPVTNPSGGALLEVWNSTQCIEGSAWPSSASGWEWRPPQGGIVPFSEGITAAYALQTNSSAYPLPTNWAIWGINSGVAVLDAMDSSGLTLSFQAGFGIFAGYDITSGNQLWIENVSFTPFTSVSLNCGWLLGDGVWTTITKETGQLNGYSTSTGKQLWTDTLTGYNGAAPDPYNSVGGYLGTLAGNSLIMFGFGGDVWSVNMLTGAINWYTNTTTIQGPAGDNSPYGIWPIWEQTGISIAGGIIFLEEGHEYSPPLFIGAQQLALNLTTGNPVWSINAFDVDGWPSVAYGIMTTINAYDNQIYAYGQGPSATTINAPQVGITTNTPVTITGKVTDISAGSKQEAVAANYPEGLPCVSDSSMSQFMESVYMQQPIPNNTTGVPVTISVIDSNNNYRIIGTTTSSAQGTYSLTWTPDISGNYTVTATFAGTGSYYGSSATTALYAGTPAATTAPTSAPAANVVTMSDLVYSITAASIAIIIAIAIVGFLLLRKKP